VLRLSLAEAIERGLKYNLALLLTEQDERSARGARWEALGDVLPNLTTRTSETRQQVDLAAFGFTNFPGIPLIVGPFNVFDTRAFLSQPVLDLKAFHRLRARSEDVRAAADAYRDARDQVVLVCAVLYIRTIAGSSRVKAAEAQLKTAQAIYQRAADLKKAGVVPGIDVLRSQVELDAQQQRLIFFQNELEIEKLDLARAIGLPVGQQFTVAESMPYSPEPPPALEESLDRAYRSRADYQRALSLERSAESARESARGEALPSLHFDANFGDIGALPARSHETFAIAGTLEIPVFQGGRVHGRMLEEDALLEKRKSELEDLRSRIDYEVRTAYLNLKAARDRLEVADHALALAKDQMQQAQDRFSAGVANSLEVVEAQSALATADENYISSLYNYNVARGSLSRARGTAEEDFKRFIGGSH
jgi:outer membrane protein TolC